jgi:hypothetical protein
MAKTVFEGKRAGEVRTLTFDFANLLATAETISTQSVAATVYTGTDAAPSNVISGSASASNSIVSQKVTGGTAGNIYNLICTITTSAGQTLKISGLLAILPEQA